MVGASLCSRLRSFLFFFFFFLFFFYEPRAIARRNTSDREISNYRACSLAPVSKRVTDDKLIKFHRFRMAASEIVRGFPFFVEFAGVTKPRLTRSDGGGGWEKKAAGRIGRKSHRERSKSNSTLVRARNARRVALVGNDRLLPVISIFPKIFQVSLSLFLFFFLVVGGTRKGWQARGNLLQVDCA